MTLLGKKMILDLARLSSICYNPPDKINALWSTNRPYNKCDNVCVFNCIKECPILYKSNEDCEVLVCNHDTNALIVSFRGTSSNKDILTDLRVSREKLPLANMSSQMWPLVHSGFKEQFFSINTHLEKKIKAHDTIIFCGHSLGGALATIGSLYYAFQYPNKNIACVTFGSPRVGDGAFVSYFNQRITNTLRYVNDNDPVPCVPTRWRFKHVDGLQWLNQDQIHNEVPVWRFYRFIKNTMLSIIGYGYNAFDDHKCDNYIHDIRTHCVSSSK